jgi:hypothetical protein
LLFHIRKGNPATALTTSALDLTTGARSREGELSAKTAKHTASTRLTGTYMNAALQRWRANPTRRNVLLKPGASVQESQTAQVSDQRKKDCDRLRRELIWVLISILLFLYFATSYLFVAKIESAWPISR